MAAHSDVVILDIDGTLLDSTYHHALAWQRAFDRLGHHVPLWRIHRSVGMGGDRLVAAVAGPQMEQRHGDALRGHWREEYLPIRHEPVPLPGATDLVDDLAGRGFAVAVASSGDPQFAREAIATLGIRRHVAVLTTAEDASSSKPAPDLVGVTLERLGGAGRAVMVGDTPYDVESAARAGLACVGLRSGGYHEAELTEAGAALVVDAPADLIGRDWTDLLQVPASGD